jgi:hypothetical protein
MDSNAESTMIIVGEKIKSSQKSIEEATEKRDVLYITKVPRGTHGPAPKREISDYRIGRCHENKNSSRESKDRNRIRNPHSMRGGGHQL